MILDDIVRYKKTQIAKKKRRVSLSSLYKLIDGCSFKRRSFGNALRAPRINIIAEIKKASPSKGIFCQSFNPRYIAKEYEIADVSAISVLTETHFFKGSLLYIEQVRNCSTKPILRKDFIVDMYQVPETVASGADAVLLIASILSTTELKQYISALKKYDIDSLVEVHTHDELLKALDAGASIIGINNRNLHTFEVSLETTFNLVKHIPSAVTIVSESGIEKASQIHALRNVGVHAFLIGESIVRSNNIVQQIANLRGGLNDDKS
jgi:indole-3-glycerol phosphate synthase